MIACQSTFMRLILGVLLVLGCANAGPSEAEDAASRIIGANSPVWYADALVQFPQRDHTLTLDIYVTHGVIGDDYVDQLEVLALRCTVDGCIAAGMTRAPLAPGAFTYSQDLTRASLRTSWLGKPLVISWRANRGSVVQYSNSNTGLGAHHYEFVIEHARRYLTSTTYLLGRRKPCPGWSLSTLSVAEKAIGTALVNFPPTRTGDMSSNPELKARVPNCR